MRLTRALLEKVLPTNSRTAPRPNFRRPMQGFIDPKHQANWDTSLNEIDEEEQNELGQVVPVKEKVPVIMVPDLKDCKYQPYVTYKVEKHYEPPVTSKDLFDMFYAPGIEAEVTGVQMESVPDPANQPGLVNRVKGLFKSKETKS